MAGDALQALWAEPRPAHPPVRVWRDWVLVAVVVLWSAVETMLREDVAWRPVALTVAVVVALTLLWRRTHPLAAITVAFGTLTVVDVARIFAAEHNGLLWSIAASLVLPYSLFRWGAGREAGIGLGVLLTWLAVTSVADPTGAAQVVGGFGFFLFSAALGASIRYYANARIRDIERAKLRQRNQFARELHDTVGHYVSAIAIQAQAGQTLAASHPDRRVPGPTARGHRPDRRVDLWWSGKHAAHGGNVQVIAAPDGWPLWTSPVRAGREHDTTALRAHAQALPLLAEWTDAEHAALADLGYEGERAALTTPIKHGAGRRLTEDQRTVNLLHAATRAPAERGNSLLKTTFKALRRVSLCPWRIGAITAAALVLLHREHDRTT